MQINGFLGGKTLILVFANFYCLYIPIFATFNLPMGPAYKNPEYFTIVSQYQLTLAHYWFSLYFFI